MWHHAIWSEETYIIILTLFSTIYFSHVDDFANLHRIMDSNFFSVLELTVSAERKPFLCCFGNCDFKRVNVTGISDLFVTNCTNVIYIARMNDLYFSGPFQTSGYDGTRLCSHC